MPKLSAGERVEQKFEVALKFKAEEGDTKLKASAVKELFADLGPESGAPITVVVKEV